MAQSPIDVSVFLYLHRDSELRLTRQGNDKLRLLLISLLALAFLPEKGFTLTSRTHPLELIMSAEVCHEEEPLPRSRPPGLVPD